MSLLMRSHRLVSCFLSSPDLVQEPELVVSCVPSHLEWLALLAVDNGNNPDRACNRVLAEVVVSDTDRSTLLGLQGDFLRHLEHRVVGAAPEFYGHWLVGIIGKLELIGMTLARIEVGKR